VLLNTALNTCIQQREFRYLEKILGTYEKSGMRPSAHTYGLLIKGYSTLKQVQRCRDLWAEMKDRTVEPHEITCGCMIDALVCNGLAEEAVQILSEWKTKHSANTIMYSCLIKGFSNLNKPERTLEIFQEMRAEGVQINSVTFNALIDAQARVGAMDKVQMLLEQMEQDGVKLDRCTYSTIVKGYCVKGDLEKAMKVFHGRPEHDPYSDVIIFNTLLDGCIRHSRSDIADQLLLDMDKHKIVPSNHTLTTIVKMWGRRRQLNKAFEAIEQLTKKFGFQANSHVHTCLMSACLSNGDISRALKIFEQIKQGSQFPDAKSYSTLVGGCVRHGELKQAVKLVEEAFGLTGARPALPAGAMLETTVLEQLLKGLAQKGLSHQVALPLLERLRTAKVPIEAWLYTLPLQGAGDQPRQATTTQRDTRAARPWAKPS